MMAIGQSSTDSVRAHGANPMGLRATLSGRGASQGVRAPRLETRTAVGWCDQPPGPKPTATAKVHAVFENWAHGWRSYGYGT